MEELINFINEKKDLSITTRTKNKLRMWWYELDKIGFYLTVSTGLDGKYKCSGEVLTGYDYETSLFDISKTVNSEKEVINLVEDMMSTSKDILEFIANKSKYFE